MKNAKKMLAWLLVLSMMLVLCACAGNEKAAGAEAPDPGTTAVN